MEQFTAWNLRMKWSNWESKIEKLNIWKLPLQALHNIPSTSIYLAFAMQLKIGIDSIYQAWLFDTFSNYYNLHTV